MSTKLIRDKIDMIDRQILKLLSDRMQQSVMIRKFKTQTEDKDREAQVLEKIADSSFTILDKDFTRQLYKLIMEESKKVQNSTHIVVGFQGEHGAYSEEAAKKWDKNCVAVPNPEFEDVFESVESGLYDYGIVPVENNLGGVVGGVNSLLLKKNIKVVAAVEIPISHCLMILPGSDYREIRNVYSHSQALSQCRDFINRNKLEPVQYYDTAGSAKMIFQKRLKGAAAIANKLAANLYNLEIVKEDIQDRNDNRTRFFIISKEDNRTEKGKKCSIVFSTQHKAGTLFSVLNLFAEKEINLTRIESIPTEPGEFAFFLDFLLDEQSGISDEVFSKLKVLTTSFKLLGFYNEISFS